jgi:hypothetical protein
MGGRAWWGTCFWPPLEVGVAKGRTVPRERERERERHLNQKQDWPGTHALVPLVHQHPQAPSVSVQPGFPCVFGNSPACVRDRSSFMSAVRVVASLAWAWCKTSVARL